MPEPLLRAVDEARGETSRSSWIVQAAIMRLAGEGRIRRKAPEVRAAAGRAGPSLPLVTFRAPPEVTPDWDDQS